MQIGAMELVCLNRAHNKIHTTPSQNFLKIPLYKIARNGEGSHQHLRNGMILFETFLVYG